MKFFIQSRPIIWLLLVSFFISIYFSSQAVTPANPVDHKEIMRQYIRDMRTLQDQVFYLSEIVLRDSAADTPTIANGITLINGSIEELNRSISNYLATVPSISSENRDILLAFNALNFAKNSLYQLSLLENTVSSVDRALLLEDFYLFRRAATETLTLLENLISRD
ncbi:MAG: hypothetical protein K0R69_2433 [Clostridia bacterium]|jgi:hypothetical protein|nr:hypothetical protein [Clostridia bacterium]